MQGLGRRLVDAGVSLYRVSLGGMLLHPVFGALDVVWNARDDTVVNQMMPRSVLTTPEFQDSPFFWAISQHVPFHRFRLEDGPADAGFPIFRRLREAGVTDYLLFFETYGRSNDVLWADLPSGMEGVILSLSTRRIGGFTDFEIDYVRALMRPFALCIKSITMHALARALLDTYLGKYTGNRVLDGMVERRVAGTALDAVRQHVAAAVHHEHQQGGALDAPPPRPVGIFLVLLQPGAQLAHVVGVATSKTTNV